MAEVAAAPEKLSVTVRWTAEDAEAYTAIMSVAQVVGDDVPSLWRTWSLRIGAAALVGGIGLWRTGSSETAAALSLITFLAVYHAPGLYTQDWTSRRAHADIMKRDPAPYEESTVSITPDGITQTTGLSATMMKWGGVQDITMAKGILVIWSSRASGAAIPVRCFATEAEAAAFMEQARRWRQVAAGAATPD
jgi:hypothetical protein